MAFYHVDVTTANSPSHGPLRCRLYYYWFPITWPFTMSTLLLLIPHHMALYHVGFTTTDSPSHGPLPCRLFYYWFHVTWPFTMSALILLIPHHMALYHVDVTTTDSPSHSPLPCRLYYYWFPITWPFTMRLYYYWFPITWPFTMSTLLLLIPHHMALYYVSFTTADSPSHGPLPCQNQNQNQNLKASSITAYSGSLEYYFMLNFVDCAFSTVLITSVILRIRLLYIVYIYGKKIIYFSLKSIQITNLDYTLWKWVPIIYNSLRKWVLPTVCFTELFFKF